MCFFCGSRLNAVCASADNLKDNDFDYLKIVNVLIEANNTDLIIEQTENHPDRICYNCKKKVLRLLKKYVSPETFEN